MNKKFIKLAAVLGLAEINLHSGLFGNKNYAKLDEKQLEQLQAALDVDSNNLRTQIDQLETKVQELEGIRAKIESSVEQSLELNELEAGETLEASIALLGETCKTYGDSKNRNAVPPIEGTDPDLTGSKLIGGVVDPSDDIYEAMKKL